MPATASTLTVEVTVFTASDDLAVTGYLITETETAPLTGDAGWSATAPSTFTFSGWGSKTAYAWAKDAAGNISQSLSASVTIYAPTTSFTVTGLATPRTAGSTGSVTITAKDSFGNTATGYTGTVHFTSSDPQATLPADYTFVAGDAGVHTVAGVTLKTAGTLTVTVTDTVVPSITGTQSGIVVNPAGAGSLSVTGITTPRVAGATATVVVTAKDAYGNTATGYTGTVHFTSTDAQAYLPSNYTFVAGDNGVHTFTNLVALKTVGTYSVTVTDTVTGSITGSQSGITVNPAGASILTVTGITTPLTAGTADSVTVTAKDAYGNTATGYTGTVHFTSSDVQATLPANYTFVAGDNGVHTFTNLVTLKTVGSQSVTATDTVTGSITGSQSGITVNPAGVSTLSVTGITTPRTAGTAGTVIVTAKDAYGNTTPGYTGTVHFTGSDAQAILPADYTFVAGDNGVHSFSNLVTLKTAGTWSVTATDTVTSSITGSQSNIVVNPAGASTLIVEGLASPRTAGIAGTVSVTAKDAYGNTATGYTGTVRFTSNDPQSSLPADYTFITGDAGVHSFSVTLKTIGTSSVSATDTVTGSINGSQSNITVTPATAATFTVTGLVTPRTAGTSGSVTITAKDSFGNTATGYTGTVHFTSSDPQATLPPDYTFVAGDAGIHTVTGIILKTAGTLTVTVTDTVVASITGAQTGITVNPATGSTLTVTGITTPRAAGSTATVIVTAKDVYGNTATGYTGTVHFTSSDAQATLPANYTFIAADNGIHTFTNLVALKTVGNQSVTATDTVTGSITGSQSGIAVTPAGASILSVTGITTPRTAGTADSVIVTAKDAYGNTATGYTGTVHFTSSDAQATLPANYTFVAGDNGAHTFTNLVALKTVGNQSVTATDTVTGSITGSQSGITVNPADASILTVTGITTPRTAGTAGSVTVTAKDPYGNIASGYTGTVRFTGSDAQATLPADYTFVAGDNGVHSFANLVTLKTAGTWSITATDTVTLSITGTQSGITVTPAAASTLIVSGITSPRTAGPVSSVTVTAKDAYGNTATSYTGTIRFTSTDTQATLPANYTFVAGDAGVHAFTAAILKTAGTWSVTATDTVTPSISGAQSGIIVNPAAASTLVVSGLASPRSVGTAGTLVVAARDVYGNTATGYTGTVQFSSTDLLAVLPANYTFVAGDAGVHTFASQIIMKTVGMQAVTVTDTVIPTINGTQSAINVTPATASTLIVAGFESPGYVDTPGSITITAKDMNGNTVEAYRGTVHFTSTDPQAILPPDYTFVAGDAGVHTFVYQITLKTVGTWSITATDTVNPTVTGTQSAIVISTAPVAFHSAQVAAGQLHTVALDTNGHVLTWGKNTAGQLGIGTTTDESAPVLVGGVDNIIAVAAGYNHTVALNKDGTVWTWGGNSYGQLGSGGTTGRKIPAQVQGLSGITGIAAGYYHTLALKSDGTVWAWGNNSYGQVGDGSTYDTRTIPVQVQGVFEITAIAAGSYHSLFLKRDGTIWGCGHSNSGQVGDGLNYNHTVPVQASGLDAMSAIAAGALHSIALSKDGTVWVWGDNSRGQLGDGSTMNSSYPLKLHSVADATAITAGDYHSAVLKGDGTVLTWGGNSYGQLGDGSNGERHSPLQVQGLSGVLGFAGGGRHTVAFKGNGTIWAWGDNTYGQLGDGFTLFKNHFVPVQASTGTVIVASGANHNVALKTDGTVWTWGKNVNGQLGDGTLTNKSAPLQVAGLSEIISVTAGADHTVALKGDGSVWAWGANTSGQLGDGTTTNRNNPVQVQGLSGITAIAAGDYFTLALTSDGTVWAWGSNNSGQLGDGSTTNRTAPVIVGSLSGISGIAAGYMHSMALKNDGTVWAWGYNGNGQLGDGTFLFRKSPVQANVSGISAIAAGTHHSLAVETDGTLWAWGYNISGQLGDGTTVNKNIPLEIVGVYPVSSIAAGANHSLALKPDGSVWSWGDNYYGQLGDATATNKSLPQQLPDFLGVTSIAAGDNHSSIVKSDGSIWESGNNNSGQLGDGTPYSPGIVPTAILGNDTVAPITTASLGDGTYAGARTVVLIANEPAIIRFTLDGTTPTTTSEVYSGPLLVSSSTILKFFAVDLAGNVEVVKTRNYTIVSSNTLSIAVSGSGRVDLSTGGSCSGNCGQSLAVGTTVVLVPVANTGSNFVKWTGCDSVSGQICTVTMSEAKSVTATFSTSYSLSMVMVEKGTVSFNTGGSCTGNCTKYLPTGTTVVMTAFADATTVFEGWGGCDSTTGNSCTVTMNGGRTVAAIFGYLVKSSVAGYPSLQNAYNVAPNDDKLLLRAADLTENVILNRDISVTLSGGYDRNYTSKIGQTMLNGTLTVSTGTAILEDLVIQ